MTAPHLRGNRGPAPKHLIRARPCAARGVWGAPGSRVNSPTSTRGMRAPGIRAIPRMPTESRTAEGRAIAALLDGSSQEASATQGYYTDDDGLLAPPKGAAVSTLHGRVANSSTHRHESDGAGARAVAGRPGVHRDKPLRGQARTHPRQPLPSASRGPISQARTLAKSTSRRTRPTCRPPAGFYGVIASGCDLERSPRRRSTARLALVMVGPV